MEIRGDSTKWVTTLLMLYSALWVGIDGSSRQPHIILILADDLGWDDVSFHGSDQIPTPNIDYLAYNGVILHNYYVQPICTPTRSALMTGRHPIHTGLQHNVIVAPQPYGLRPNETTMAEYLKPLGYATHMIGKWHLGFFAKEYTPTYRGFDSYYGYYCGHMDYYTHNVQWSKYWGYDMHKNMEVEWPTFGEYSTELFTTEAEKILKSHNPDKPLFLYLAYQAVHSANNKVPLQAPYKYTSRFPYIHDEKRRTFAGMLSALDDSIGNITRTLHQTGLYDNSVIIFSTDNGGPPAGFDMNYASNWPLRGTKATLWEGGVRGDGFINSPLLEKPQRISSNMIHVTDWLPTLYHLAGGNMSDLPTNLYGVNVWNTLSRGDPSPRTEILHNIDSLQHTAALRVGDYKLIIGDAYNGKWSGWYQPEEVTTRRNISVSHDPRAAVVHCGKKPANASTNCQPKQKPCLYNVILDPCEYHNIAEQYPDVVNDMLNRLTEYNSTAVEPQHPPEDPKCDPKYHKEAWVPWINLTDSDTV
ncbi:arylsulfatase I-like isoform X2 [Ptychodera flava]|uniref:arylsulfatase I-like isoform X2 n=1 Tax=Ptychodera flava TaxID=63121 RepID=UPI00396A6B8F